MFFDLKFLKLSLEKKYKNDNFLGLTKLKFYQNFKFGTALLSMCTFKFYKKKIALKSILSIFLLVIMFLSILIHAMEG